MIGIPPASPAELYILSLGLMNMSVYCAAYDQSLKITDILIHDLLFFVLLFFCQPDSFAVFLNVDLSITCMPCSFDI